MNEKIETFYTGGGITIAEADVDVGHYAVVSSEAPEFLSVYAYSDGEKTYLPDDMVSSASKEDLPAELNALYRKMLDKLHNQ